MTPVGAGGWLVAVVLGARLVLLRARLEAVARADHELRGPVTALSLCAASLARAPGMESRAAALDAQLARLRAGLADLAAARRLGVRRRAVAPAPPLPLEQAVRATAAGWAEVAGALGRELAVDWRAGDARVAIDCGRLAQSLGNVLANALEHGRGDVAVCAVRSRDALRIEVRDGVERGRGFAIAARAAAEAGGGLTLRRDDGAGATATIELPLAS